MALPPSVSIDPLSRSHLKKHISVDGSKPVQLSVKQDGAVDVFEMQVNLPLLWYHTRYVLILHLEQ